VICRRGRAAGVLDREQDMAMRTCPDVRSNWLIKCNSFISLEAYYLFG
jgi:hypothetical protein